MEGPKRGRSRPRAGTAMAVTAAVAVPAAGLVVVAPPAVPCGPARPAEARTLGTRPARAPHRGTSCTRDALSASRSASRGTASLLGAGAQLTGRPGLERSTKIGAVAAGVLSLAGLVHDLGRPSPFLHMLRVFKVTSPMSVGSWLLAGYVPLAGGGGGVEPDRSAPAPRRARHRGRGRARARRRLLHGRWSATPPCPHGTTATRRCRSSSSAPARPPRPASASHCPSRRDQTRPRDGGRGRWPGAGLV